MQVTETLNEGLKRGYAIKVPASELESKVTEKLEEARKDFQMKGFRKGKAPAALMKKMFGKSVLGEAMQESIDKAMRDHFEASGDRPALQPEVKVQNEDWQEGQDVEVTMTYEALPQVPEVAFSEIALEKLVAEIDEAAVDEALQNLAASAKVFEGAAVGVVPRDESLAELETWARYWERWISAEFLRAWLDRARGAAFGLLPPQEVAVLLDVFLLEKAAYELAHELNNRPGWVGIPLEGILQILADEGEEVR